MKTETIKKVERDHMPASVATDLLCTKPRLTNRERKTYMEARYKVFESTLLPLPIEEQLNRRLQNASWAQLDKWDSRCKNRRADAQRAYLLAERRKNVLVDKIATAKDEREKTLLQFGSVQFDRLMQSCSLKAKQLDMFRDAIEEEKQRRIDGWNSGQGLKYNLKPAAECPGANPRTGRIADPH